ncbi:unnamed protein product [Rhizophagus irregularis]|uniref:Uncharacterized protein n=1 Tax=Rhizophagus irregularis TaxID=588596 RepID=A0A915YPU1_9GLOM|nr:unnamed protein product [Rhizophagus irregularis]
MLLQLQDASRNPCDLQGNPWPTIIAEEEIKTELLCAVSHAINSVVQQAYKLQNVHGNYQPVQIIEFGTIDRNNQPYNGCTAAGMCIMNIFPGCIFRGYPQVPPYPINNVVVIDFFPIQQAIFRAM